ncbi:MAG TPA: RsmE family RNA methyltransferase [Gemmatimonadales bacterium]|nr:RsmE family RNA methyltransferase [Gemmatimonadales bacterium]
MITVLLPPGRLAAGDVVSLDPAEIHHLRVRRAGEVVPVQLRDGQGLLGAGVVRSERGAVQVVVERAEQVARPLPLRLAVAAGDRDRFAWLVEKATELGVTDLVPVETDRTAAVASRIREGQLGRLRRRALEAIKQCGAPWAPVVHPARPLAEFLAEALHGDRWLADRSGQAPQPGFGVGPVTVLVGPEGGLSDQETQSARAAGFRPLRLAEHVLRFETAAVAAAACAAAARVAQSGGLHG